MPATDSDVTSMEDPHALVDEEGSVTNIPSSNPPTTVPALTPLCLTSAQPNFTIENKAVSVASNDFSLIFTSPTEASPAKSASTSPTTLDGSVEKSHATTHIASASDSLKSTEKSSMVNISELPSPLPLLLSSTFGCQDTETEFPNVLSYKGVSVTLENNSVWKQFYGCGTEMILTKQGRRMFPYCRYRLAGLEPWRYYSLVLSIVPTDQLKYRWNNTKWEITGLAENQSKGLTRAFSHHYSPCRGSEWMGTLLSFYKLKLTNNPQDQEGHLILHSMHRYIPRLHVIPLPDENGLTDDQPVVMGPECITFTFPQTEFMAVTTYQNFRITQLKINHNPFAKGFREDGNNPRLNRVPLPTEAQPVVKTDTQSSDLEPVELDEKKEKTETQPSDVEPDELKEEEEVVDLSIKNQAVSARPSNEKVTRLVLKPIMSTSSNKDEPYVPCIRGKHALGELVLVEQDPDVEPKVETDAISATPEEGQGFSDMPTERSSTPSSTPSTPESLPGSRKKKKRINRRWANSRGREWKAAAASPTVAHSPSLTVAMQPELDDVEGLLFVSFNSKEALEVHATDKPANSASSASPVSPTTLKQRKPIVEVIAETDEEKMTRLEAIVLQDLRIYKHRQVIHPVLQEVGLKLSSLDPTKSIDLQYLGVQLPLPPPKLPEQAEDTALSPADKGLPFISRTGKTRDMTKIKGWKNKFILRKETSPSNCDGSQKNLSAFCSNMLDEYLESEEQYISERAAAFSTNPEGSVAYQLPAKSSSYVKTLDSVLKHRKTASISPAGANNRPCPLSHKPLLYSTLRSPPPALAGPATPDQAASSHTQLGASGPQRLSTYQPGVSQRPGLNFGQSHGMTHRPAGLTKYQFKLLQLEIGALNQGLTRTQLTADRLSVAMSVMLTKQTLPNQILKCPNFPECAVEGPACGAEFCRLGCVCSSLKHLNRGPLHCRRTECMFGCACFKRKITKQLAAGETEELIEPVYSVSNMEHVVQPGPGSHVYKLWNRNIHVVDPDPISAPESSPLHLPNSKFIRRSITPHVTQPIREEDKDPVYKYYESMMTCARVREFNSKPPPVVEEPKFINTSTPNSTAEPLKINSDNQRKKYRTLLAVKKPENTSTFNERGAKKQIEIQSGCDWDKDRKVVLEALCRRLSQNRLSQRFFIGPYLISPITKIALRKSSGSTVTYRLHISKPLTASDNDEEEEYEESDEEQHDNPSLARDMGSELEEGQVEDPGMRFGVIPFLSGVPSAGRLRARTKRVGCQEYGLIQVNGKSYNQARLLLGNMGSLHPANRLAAYITGRLKAPADISNRKSQISASTNKISTPGILSIKAAGTVVPPIITARKTTDLKTATQPPVQLIHQDSSKKESLTLLQHLQNSSNVTPFQSFVSSQRSSVSDFLKSSATSAPVSLTVSPSLKTPSFLAQSGTYSFRICPPANQGTKAQNLAGVTLPGGFTLIQLPKPGAHGAAQQSESVNATDTAGVHGAPPRKRMRNICHLSADSVSDLLRVQTPPTKPLNLSSSRSAQPPPFAQPRPLSQPGPYPPLMCIEKMLSGEIDQALRRHLASGGFEHQEDLESEDLSSDSSDYSGDDACDVDEDDIDIETVEEGPQGMKEAVLKALQNTCDSSDGLGSERGLQDQIDKHGMVDKRRRNHTALERQRRSEQRFLFDRLQAILRADHKAPRLRLLSLAVKEIQRLVKISKFQEEEKRRLTQVQSVYVQQLSLLSGKSDKQIKDKLKVICEMQKMKEKKMMNWKPVFSQLLQSRAALLQSAAPRSKPQPKPLLQPFFSMPSSMPRPNPHRTTAPHFAHYTSMPPPRPPPQTVSSLAQARVTAAPSIQAEKQPAQARVTAAPSLQAEKQPAQARVTAPPSLQAEKQPAQARVTAAPSIQAEKQPAQTRVAAPPSLQAEKQQAQARVTAAPSLQAEKQPAQARVAAPPSLQAEKQPAQPVASVAPVALVQCDKPKIEGPQEKPVVKAQVSVPKSQTECKAKVPSFVAELQVTKAQEGASTTPTTPKSKVPSACPPKPISLPLIRTKTGRIILPSSLKPLGNGFYTLTLMQAEKEKAAKGEVSSTDNVQPSDVPSSKNEEKSVPESDQPSDSKSSVTVEENKTVQSSNSGAKPSGGPASLAGLSLLNKSISSPTVALKIMENSQAGGTARLSFNHVPQVPIAAEPKTSPSPLPFRRPRGRPRRNQQVSPAGETRRPTVVQDTSDSETSILVEERQTEIFTPEAIKRPAEGIPSMVGVNPVPVKRGRGRPPKQKSAHVLSPTYRREESSPSEDSKDSNFTFPRNPATTTFLRDRNAARPLTRGSLGKDFPSAKKRSWIDVEKELEQEQEQEEQEEL